MPKPQNCHFLSVPSVHKSGATIEQPQIGYFEICKIAKKLWTKKGECFNTVDVTTSESKVLLIVVLKYFFV